MEMACLAEAKPLIYIHVLVKQTNKTKKTSVTVKFSQFSILTCELTNSKPSNTIMTDKTVV